MPRRPERLARAGAAALLAVFLAAQLGGCATRLAPRYAWGDYPALLLEGLRADDGQPGADAQGGAQAQLQQLQADLARASGQLAVPPGLHAHIGLLQLRLGRPDLAALQFQAEKAAFAEAAPFMDFLLRGLAASRPAEQTAPAVPTVPTVPTVP